MPKRKDPTIPQQVYTLGWFLKSFLLPFIWVSVHTLCRPRNFKDCWTQGWLEAQSDLSVIVVLLLEWRPGNKWNPAQSSLTVGPLDLWVHRMIISPILKCMGLTYLATGTAHIGSLVSEVQWGKTKQKSLKLLPSPCWLRQKTNNVRGMAEMSVILRDPKEAGVVVPIMSSLNSLV